MGFQDLKNCRREIRSDQTLEQILMWTEIEQQPRESAQQAYLCIEQCSRHQFHSWNVEHTRRYKYQPRVIEVEIWSLMYKASYNSLFLRVLWTGEEGSRFMSSGGRSFPWDSSQAFSSRIFRLFARSEREGWTHWAIRGTNNKKHPSPEAASKQCLNCFFRLLSYSLKLHLLPNEAVRRVNENQALAIRDSSSSDK